MVSDSEEKKIGLFDVLNMIEGEKIPWNELSDDYKSAYNNFMINRFISSKECFVPFVEMASTAKFTPEQHYEYFRNIIDNKRKHYFDYKAYKKDKKDENNEFLIYCLCKEYEIGKREAKLYFINNINEEEKQSLIKKWKLLYENEKNRG